jgi:transcriptional antiterminator NusG
MADAVETDVNGGAAGPANPDLRWYIVHAYSGMEKAVERNIAERIARSDMQSKFGRILVPSEEVVEMRNGTRRTERRLFPGYVFVEMVMDDDTWHLVKHTSKVTGFVGGAKNRPAPFLKKKFARSSTRCRRAPKAPPQGRVHGGRNGSCQGRSVRGLQRLRRGSQLRKEPSACLGHHLWPRDSCGIGILSS